MTTKKVGRIKMITIKFIGESSKYNFKSVLPFNVKTKGATDKEILQNTKLTSAWVKGIQSEIKNMKHLDDVVNITPVVEHAGKWVKGEYHAHEYPEGENYVDGKARKLKFKDVSGVIVYEIYEVKCLDKSKRVIDGYWEEAGASRLNSGTGDHFTPFEKGLGI